MIGEEVKQHKEDSPACRELKQWGEFQIITSLLISFSEI
jgi:hypothetical protein